MKIKKLRINGYGKFTDTEIVLKDGLNLVFGKNEAGKSTIQSFIKAMLFDFPRKNIDGEGRLPASKKYKPWSGSDFGGILEIETDDGRILKIDRDFARKNASVFDNNLQDITPEFPYTKKNGLAVGEALLNMDRECFENTSFIKQGGTIVLQDDRKNLFDKLMNISQTGNENTSASSAKAALSTAATALGNNRTKNRPYNIAFAEHRRLSQQLEDANKKRSEMKGYSNRQEILEREIKTLKNELNKYESSVETAGLKKERDLLLQLKRKYDGFSDDIQTLSSEIFATGQQIEKNKLPANITESEILDNIRKTASAIEKQKSIDDGDPEEKLIRLEKSKQRKHIWLALSYIGVSVTVLLAILFHPAIFALTAVVTAILIYLHIKRPNYSSNELHEQLKLIKECTQDLILINAFIESAECQKVLTFKDAENTLNDLFEMKKQYSLLENRLIRQKERKADLEKFRGDVLGQYSDIGQIENLLKDIASKFEESGNDELTNDKFIITNPKIELEEKQRELSGAKAVLNEYMQSDEELAQLEESLAFYKEKLESIQTEIQSLEIASEIITQAAENMQKDIIPRLNEKTGVILNQITNGLHSTLATSLDNDVNTEYQNSVHSLWEFSDGTIDQMYFALRIAASEVFSEKESVPIIIDEAFAYYDETRIKSTFDFLSEIAKSKQIVVFTCKEKEIDLVSEYDNINIIRI
ncbi:MAG: AAA family ATPase [Clostridiales bacterium]|nr:AAA family ATPase [Clostridiales bacterium]